jgi:actin-related protein
MALVLPSTLPLPLLSTTLDTLFNNFQPPTISLMSAPVLTTVAAGLRAALVVDIGWAETLVTSVYEYREVQCRRSIRATRLLAQETLRVIWTALKQKRQQQKDIESYRDETTHQDAISFEECEEIVARLGWCKPSSEEPEFMDALEGLPPVREEEVETALASLNISNDGGDMIPVPLSSSSPPTTLQLPFSVFAEPCERAFFADGIDTIELDDEELPLHLLIYRSLLHLPVDVRSVCMARVIFTGGGSNIVGLKSRIVNEVCGLIQDRGWDPVRGKAVEQPQASIRKRLNRSRQSNGGPTEARQIEPNNSANTEDSITGGQAAFEAQEADPIEEQIRREARNGDRQTAQGTLRAVESLGAWGGGSLLSLFKTPAVSLVEREQWLQHGVAGASKQSELPTINQRQSIGPSGLRAGLGDRSNWTLGPWG